MQLLYPAKYIIQHCISTTTVMIKATVGLVLVPSVYSLYVLTTVNVLSQLLLNLA